ncbi:hypothetical protein MY9_0893 [Bacillus sp. JS]|nr:hypothetical protein MY9_0893 [Bacillus sp. JS]
MLLFTLIACESISYQTIGNVEHFTFTRSKVKQQTEIE